MYGLRVIIEVFYNQDRIASHRRLYGRKGQYSTITEHMPKEHQHYLEWNGERFRKWAEGIGENTVNVIDAVLRSKRFEQQSYRACMGLLKLADKYSPPRLEEACKTALSYTQSPSYKSVSMPQGTMARKPGMTMLIPLRTMQTASREVPTITGGTAHDKPGNHRQTH